MIDHQAEKQFKSTNLLSVKIPILLSAMNFRTKQRQRSNHRSTTFKEYLFSQFCNKAYLTLSEILCLGNISRFLNSSIYKCITLKPHSILSGILHVRYWRNCRNKTDGQHLLSVIFIHICLLWENQFLFQRFKWWQFHLQTFMATQKPENNSIFRWRVSHKFSKA